MGLTDASDALSWSKHATAYQVLTYILQYKHILLHYPFLWVFPTIMVLIERTKCLTTMFHSLLPLLYLGDFTNHERHTFQ
jgi:hypothetical protein